MGSAEPSVPDAPACPLLGLASDRRSHFTYPHPAHRCYATDRPVVVDARHQSAYCIGVDYPDCPRHIEHHFAASRRLPSARPPDADVPSVDAARAARRGPMPHVVIVARPGDSLARIAATYGVEVERLAEANDLPSDARIPDGRRLILPLGSHAGSDPGSDGGSTAGGG